MRITTEKNDCNRNTGVPLSFALKHRLWRRGKPTHPDSETPPEEVSVCDQILKGSVQGHARTESPNLLSVPRDREPQPPLCALLVSGCGVRF